MTNQSEQRDRYWSEVARALGTFGWPVKWAVELRANIDMLPSSTQELFYHSAPFDVARELAGLSDWPQHEYEAFTSRAQSEGSTRSATQPRRLTRPRRVPLTPLEWRIVRACRRKLTVGEAARHLSLPRETFRAHLLGLIEKLPSTRIARKEQQYLRSWAVALEKTRGERA